MRFLYTERTSRAGGSPKPTLEGAAPSLRASFSRQLVEDDWSDAKDLFNQFSDFETAVTRRGFQRAEAKQPHIDYWKKYTPLNPTLAAPEGKKYGVAKVTVWVSFKLIKVTVRFGNYDETGKFFFRKAAVRRFTFGAGDSDVDTVKTLEHALSVVDNVTSSSRDLANAVARLRHHGFKSVAQ